MLHSVCCEQRRLMQAVAYVCVDHVGIFHHHCWYIYSVFKRKTSSSLVDAKPSAHAHCVCVLREMIRGLKMYIQFVCCAISSSCFSLHCLLGY